MDDRWKPELCQSNQDMGTPPIPEDVQANPVGTLTHAIHLVLAIHTVSPAAKPEDVRKAEGDSGRHACSLGPGSLLTSLLPSLFWS